MSDEEEYEVESIVSKRIKKGKVKQRLIFWSKAKLFVIVFKRMMQMYVRYLGKVMSHKM
jgi:hypothetical protein